MYTFVIILSLIVCVLLVFVILAQNSKGGVSAQFGGQMASQMFGAKKGADLLERLTWGFVIALFVFSLSTNFMTTARTVSDDGSPNLKKAAEKKSVLPSNPNQGTQGDAKKEEKKSDNTTKPETKKEEKK
jgi:preprotein translocase subunit SecG